MGWFADPVFFGDYPEEMRKTVRKEGGRAGGRGWDDNAFAIAEGNQTHFGLSSPSLSPFFPPSPSLSPSPSSCSAAIASPPSRRKRKLIFGVHWIS